MKNIKKKKEDEKKIARERIDILFSEAEKTKDEKLKKRYVVLARKISTKFRMRIPKEHKRKFCRKCNSYFIPGKNVRVRLKNQKVIYSCFLCKHYTRLPYVREIKERRRISYKIRKPL
jgi:ribonuclease P protein subunit RPR2